MASPIGAASWDFSTGPARFFSLPFASLTTFATRRLLMSPDYPAARLDMCERRRLPPVRRLWLLLPSSARLPTALAAGRLLLGCVATAAATAALAAAAAARALSAPARGSLRVGDRRSAGLAHPLLAQALVLLVAL